MDLIQVCGPSSSPGVAEYLLGVAIGFLINVRMWAHHQRLARRVVARTASLDPFGAQPVMARVEE